MYIIRWYVDIIFNDDKNQLFGITQFIKGGHDYGSKQQHLVFECWQMSIYSIY